MRSGSGLIQELFGCQWGRAVGLPDDNEPCPEQARQIMVVHDKDNNREMPLAVCDVHWARLMIHTDPHAE